MLFSDWSSDVCSSDLLPRRELQTWLYREVLETAGERPVVFRTLDIGGDKALPYLREEEGADENPAMGWRALRLALERDGLMKVQSRALLEAAAGRTLNIMFPMVSEPWEFDAAQALVEEQRAWLKKQGKPMANQVRYGAMMEVPALAEQLDLLLPKIDFLSIGTNDLTQFMFAADRANPKLADRYDWLSPAILRFIARVTAQAQAADVQVTVCGEMGGRPLEAMALIGLGITRLSITPAAIGPVKSMVRSLKLKPLKAQMERWLKDPRSCGREAMIEFAEKEGIEII